MINIILRFLRAGLYVSLVTAAGYPGQVGLLGPGLGLMLGHLIDALLFRSCGGAGVVAASAALVVVLLLLLLLALS